MVRFPCGLRETEPLAWPTLWGASTSAASHMQAVMTYVFANETWEGKFPAYLVSNREALQVPRTILVRPSFIRINLLQAAGLQDFTVSLRPKSGPQEPHCRTFKQLAASDPRLEKEQA
jgi:hypothetical protein